MSRTESSSPTCTPTSLRHGLAVETHFTGAEKLAMAILLTANFTLAVDFSILNVALPHVGDDLGFATSQLQWIISAFALCAAGFTLFFGRVADLFGRKRLFLGGIVLLGVSSLVGGLAQEPTVLIAARVGQGLATAMVTPAALSLMTTMFPEGPIRSRALGLNGALMAAGFTTGAVLGGVLTGAVSWRWAFFINVVVALAVIPTAPFALREPAPTRRTPLDVLGAALITSALGSLVLGIDAAGRTGWSDPTTWAPIVVAAILTAAFLAVESHVREPLVPPSLLRQRNVAWGNGAGLLAFATETSLVFLLTLYLQDVLGYSPITAGLALGVLGIGTVIGGLISPKIIGRTGSTVAMIAGFVFQAAATIPLAFVSNSHGWLVPLLVASFVGGMANLVVIVGYTVTSTASVPADQQGLATGLVTTSQQVGITLGTPVMSAVVTAFATSTLLPGLRAAIAVNAGLALIAALLVAAFLHTPRSQSGAR